jgi:hypothetical protein
MGEVPLFAPSPVDFALVASQSQSQIGVSSPPLAEATTVTVTVVPPLSALALCPFSAAWEVVETPVVVVRPGARDSTSNVLADQLVGGRPPATGIEHPEDRARIVRVPGGPVIGPVLGAQLPSFTGDIAAGKTVGIEVVCHAPANSSKSPVSFAATLVVSSTGWDSSVSVPLTVHVAPRETADVGVSPVKVIQDHSVTVPVTVTTSAATDVILGTPPMDQLPEGLTITFAGGSVEPVGPTDTDNQITLTNVGPGTPQSAQLTGDHALLGHAAYAVTASRAIGNICSVLNNGKF